MYTQYAPQINELLRELGHLSSELFDTSHSVGLRVEVMASDEAGAIRYVETRIRTFRKRGWVEGTDYTLVVKR